MNLNIHSRFEWQWTCFQPKHRQCHASAFFHLVKRHAPFIEIGSHGYSLKAFKNQVLKYSYRSEWLSFVEDLSIAKEADYTISGQPTESVIDELMAACRWKIWRTRGKHVQVILVYLPVCFSLPVRCNSSTYNFKTGSSNHHRHLHTQTVTGLCMWDEKRRAK